MISASAVSKRYPEGLEALRDVSLDIQAGEFVFVTGHSGAGKTTLVKLMAAIERPTSGGIIVNGQNLSALRASALPFLRRNFGLVFQDQKLLFDRPVLANVLLPLEIAGTRETVRSLALDGDGFPQMLLRIGWAPLNADPLPATPRRPLSEVVQRLDGASISL